MKTSGQRTLSYGRIAAIHGRFNRVRQVVSVDSHIVHPNGHPHCLSAVPCTVALSILTFAMLDFENSHF